MARHIQTRKQEKKGGGKSCNRASQEANRQKQQRAQKKRNGAKAQQVNAPRRVKKRR